MTDSIELLLKVHRETNLAWQVSDTAMQKDATWIPKSQATKGFCKSENIFEFNVPEWLALKNGWI